MVGELTESQLLRWIPLLPLLAAALHGVLLGVVRRPLPRGVVILISCGAVIASFVISFIALRGASAPRSPSFWIRSRRP